MDKWLSAAKPLRAADLEFDQLWLLGHRYAILSPAASQPRLPMRWRSHASLANA
jgi:hypothetical protein